MAPYDVLVDPQTLPKLPKDQSDVKNKDDDAKDPEKETEVWKLPFWGWNRQFARWLCEPYPLGSLSNDGNHGSEIVANTMNLRPFKLYRVYLDPLNLSNAGAFSWSCTLYPGLYPVSKRKRDIRLELVFVCSRPRIRRFHVVVVQWTPKKCSKKRDAWRAECRPVRIKSVVFWRCRRRRRRSLFQLFR